jgi:hypothetical protein
MFLVSGRTRLIGVTQKVLTVAGIATATVIFGFVFIAVTFGTIPAANALPSFARQTGQPCGTCHTDFPALTPYGRKFKIEGYTTGGGKYRTTLFPESKPDPLVSFAREAKSIAGRKSDTGKDGQQDTGQSNTWVPPISMMAIVGYTHTQASQDPTGSPYKSNNNVVVAPVSLFYGGAITEHIGAFAQVTWNNAPFGTPDQADPYATRQVTWDNTDIRYANSAKLGGLDVIYGITANNSPTVQDPWNTTPAWGFPYAGSNVAPGPAAATLIDGGLAQYVAGAGVYAFINDLLYLELTGYRTINHDAQLKLGLDPFGAPGMSQGIMPYWRVALEPHWGNHWLEFGAFGMSARIHPWNQDPLMLDSNGFYQNVTYPQTNRYTDTAFDVQYQYQGANYWFTLRGTYIYEKQTLDASFGNSPLSDGTTILAANPTNTLNTFKALASLAYGNDNRIVLTGQYFNTKGSSDAGLYSGLASQFDSSGTPPTDPNSNGYIFEIAYIPFISSQAPVWPWANMRVGLQYTYYNRFDGDTVFAHDNNTLFAYLWFAM